MDVSFALALSHIFWIGGSPCSGKSTITAKLAAQHGLTIYGCDEMVDRHTTEAGIDRASVIHRLARASCDELWMRPVDQQVREEIVYYEEEFPFILDDLRALPRDRPVIAEGAALMLHLLESIGVPHGRSIWLVPSPAFQREHYARREWPNDALASCTDPDQAWRNWMERDIGFGRRVDNEAMRPVLTCLTVDGSRLLESILDAVRRHFGLG